MSTTPVRSGANTPTEAGSLTPTGQKAMRQAQEYVLSIASNLTDPATGLLSFRDLRDQLSLSVSITKHSASKLGSLFVVLDQLDIYYNDKDSREYWEPPDIPPVSIPSEFEYVLDWFLTTTPWYYKSCDAMTRTIIDIIALPLFRGTLPHFASRSIVFQGEYDIGAQMVNSQGVINGTADYVIGHLAKDGSDHFIASTVIIEAKKYMDSGKGIPQLLAFMVGVAQHRARHGYEVGTIYGVLADGETWQFMRLDGKHLRASTIYQLNAPGIKPIIYRFLHQIFMAAVSTPLTPPCHYAMQPRHDRFVQCTEGYSVFDYYSPRAGSSRID